MTEITVLPQKIVNRKTIVLKSRLDLTMAKLLGEKVKGKFFIKFGFFKPRSEDIRLISVHKYYVPYIVVGGRYAVDYCKRRFYAIEVQKEMREIVITRKKFKPETLNPKGHSKVVKLEGEGYFHYENETYFVLDKMGHEVAPEQVPFAPSEEQELQQLAEVGIKVEEVKISRDEEIDFLRSKIVNRPPGVEVTKEIFEVNERALVCCPIYRLTFQNVKTGKKVTLKIDGITSKITTVKPIAKQKKDAVEIHKENLSTVERRELKGKPEPSRLPPAEAKRRFPAKVAGEVFFVGDNITVAVGDAQILSGTTLVQTIVVRGHLEIGADCRIFGNVKVLKDIVIGANTTIDGDVISGGKVVIGSDSIIHGSVESEGVVETGENAVIEGGLYSKRTRTRRVTEASKHSFE